MPTPPPPEEIRYVAAWRRNDPQIEHDAIALWNETGVLPDGVDPRQRAKELCVVAYDGDRLAGVTSGIVRVHAPVRQRFVFFRIFIRPEYEKKGLPFPLVVACRDELERWSRENPQEQVAGIIAVLTHGGYGDRPKFRSGPVLVGYTQEGYQIRMHWFDHVRIPMVPNMPPIPSGPYGPLPRLDVPSSITVDLTSSR